MSDDQPALLTLRDVDLDYPGGAHVLDSVSLSVRAGEFVAIVGPSGCGKSTLLRLAAGLAEPTAGTLERTAETTGVVFQDPTLLPWRSVRRNVELLCELHGLPRKQRRARADEALARVGLSEVASHRPRTLSGGMRMRASVARALTLRPDLFLFDEPFGAVDELTRGRLGDELQNLFTADRFGAVFVTHSVAEAVYLASRVLVFSTRPGRVTGVVEIPAPYPRPPKWRFTAEFAALTAEVFARLSGDEPTPVTTTAARGRKATA